MILSWIFIVEWRLNSNFDGGVKLSYQLRGCSNTSPTLIFTNPIFAFTAFTASITSIISIIFINFTLIFISYTFIFINSNFTIIFNISIITFTNTKSISTIFSIYSSNTNSTSNIIFSYNFDGAIKFNTNTRGIVCTKSLFITITISRIKLNLITITTP